jgi:hypothetical protein
MLNLLVLFIGMAGMLGFWGLAWWLLKQPVTTAATEQRPLQAAWRNEPTQARELPPTPPPNRVLEDPGDAPVPIPRTHQSSTSNTQFFSRADMNRRENAEEGTEILHDALPSMEPTASLANPFPDTLPAPPAPSRSRFVPTARLVPPPPPVESSKTPPQTMSRKTLLIGGSVDR